MTQPRCEVIGDCELWLGDAMEIVPMLGKVDAVVTDPPFFMPAAHYQSRVNWQRAWSDTSILSGYWGSLLTLILPKIHRTGHFLTFCNHESYPVFYPVMYGCFDYLKAIIWDKKYVGLGRIWRNQHELIIAARWHTSVFFDDGKLRSDVLTHTATLYADREHPVEKPWQLLSDLIEPITQPASIVLDPFAGAASTGVACIKLRRKFVGIELDSHYFDVACRRIDAAYKQQDLFLPRVPSPTPRQEPLFVKDHTP